VKAGPDFLCVGMAKAGTGWLGDQLRHHPQFWIPFQELSYLGRDIPGLRNANRRLQRVRQRGERRRLNADDPELLFLEEIVAHAGQPRDLDRYISFFRHKGNLLSGDISPGYVMLEAGTVRSLVERLPDLRVVLLVREPVERAWSHICMWHRNGKFDGSTLNDLAQFREYLQETKVMQDAACPTRVIAHWRQFGPALHFRYYFFDDIAERPKQVRDAILEFLGADPDRAAADIPAGYNKKSQKGKLELTQPIQEALIEHFADEIRTCGRELGGPAAGWPALYGL